MPELRRWPGRTAHPRRRSAYPLSSALRSGTVALAPRMDPFHLRRGGGTKHSIGIDVTVKAGEHRTTNGAAIIEFVTRKGEEPGDHVHETEDEMFFVLEGRLRFTCDGKRFDAAPGSFVFLPRGLAHNYEIQGDDAARLLVITAPPRARQTRGWGGFVGDFESGR